MSYETIPIEAKDAGTVHILAGTITDIGDGVVDIIIDEYGSFEDVSVFYHCPGSESADGNPFSVDDRVIVVNYGDAETLSVFDMKVVGFEDGLPRICCPWTFSFPYSEVWPFSLEYESCVYLGAVQTPEFCAPWWSTPPAFSANGIFQSAFLYSESTSINSHVKQTMTFTPEIRFGDTSPELYFIVDFADIAIMGSHPFGTSMHGMFFTFRFILQHDDEIDSCVLNIGHIGSLTFLTAWSLSASGVYYDYFLRDLWGNYGPIDWDSETGKWINTEGYALKKFAIVATSISSSTGAGTYTTEAQIDFNSLKICPTYPADAMHGINFNFV